MTKTLLIISAVLLLAYLGYRTFRILTIDNNIEDQVSNGAIILDVRTSMEYESGHIKGSINIPLGQIRERYKELNPSKTYITTCSHGLRSIKVEQLLKERGFHHVSNGGAWVDLEKKIKNKNARK